MYLRLPYLVNVAFCLLIALVVTTDTSAKTFRVDASLTAAFELGEGPVRDATANFSFIFNDDFLEGASSGDMGDFPVTRFSTSLNPIGDIFYDTSNTEGYVFYNQGSLRQVLVGGVGPTVLDENRVGGNSDDFLVSVSLKPNGDLDDTFGSPGSFFYATKAGPVETYGGEIVSGSISVTPVPEPHAITLFAVQAVLMLLQSRRRR